MTIDSGYSEEFLAWMASRYNPTGSKDWWVQDVLENSLGRFMFEAWQASRAAIVIELPSVCQSDDPFDLKRDIIYEIEAAGLKTK